MNEQEETRCASCGVEMAEKNREPQGRMPGSVICRDCYEETREVEA